MNVSNIITSIVEANKNKLASGASRIGRKPDSNFDKLEEFKEFPKKKNSSIYDQSSSNSKGAMTSRSGVDGKSFEISRHSFTAESTKPNISINQFSNYNNDQK
jgi:hypothetical protein